jgi:hypothetical protein
LASFATRQCPVRATLREWFPQGRRPRLYSTWQGDVILSPLRLQRSPASTSTHAASAPRLCQASYESAAQQLVRALSAGGLAPASTVCAMGGHQHWRGDNKSTANAAVCVPLTWNDCTSRSTAALCARSWSTPCCATVSRNATSSSSNGLFWPCFISRHLSWNSASFGC